MHTVCPHWGEVSAVLRELVGYLLDHCLSACPLTSLQCVDPQGIAFRSALAVLVQKYYPIAGRAANSEASDASWLRGFLAATASSQHQSCRLLCAQLLGGLAAPASPLHRDTYCIEGRLFPLVVGDISRLCADTDHMVTRSIAHCNRPIIANTLTP